MVQRRMWKFMVILVTVAILAGCWSKTIRPTTTNKMNTTYLFMYKSSLVVIETNKDYLVGIQQFDAKEAIAGSPVPTGKRFDFISVLDDKKIRKIEIYKPDNTTDTFLLGDKISFSELKEKMGPYKLLNVEKE